MSPGRYAPHKYYSNYKKNNNIWAFQNVYRITTDQGEMMYRTYGRLDYKETIKAFYKKGYTNVHINYIGRDVTF